VISLFGIPVPFILFALTLLGVAVLHHHTLAVALTGLGSILAFSLIWGGLDLWAHLAHEWVTLANLFGLLMGFTILADCFHRSQVPELLPKYLPDGYWGAFSLLALIFVLSSFLDNIAAAMIGGTVAATVFQRRVHVGYLAAIVAASNAGGSGSVIGDTTTTMMWIDGVSPLHVVHAYGGAIVALLVMATVASAQQTRYAPILAQPLHTPQIDRGHLGIVAFVMAVAVVTNFLMNTRFAEHANDFPFMAVAVAIALLACAPIRSPNWGLLPGAIKGSVFLLALVLAASLMPVSELPAASWPSTLSLGFVSAVFDNIPLTKLALLQGGYDWGVLAYAVGFGGSMVWFGSSAGVALSNIYPEARSVSNWLRHGWHVIVAYILGFAALMLIFGWNPHPHHKPGSNPPASAHP
jgi:Na+/H+ antiporter NhaD/arsenite permease-like protein